MKNNKLFLALALMLAMVFQSCKPDVVKPGQDGQNQVGNSTDEYPNWTPYQACVIGTHAAADPECSDRTTGDLVLPNFGYFDLGNIEFLNSPNWLYIIIRPALGFYITESYAFVGPQGSVLPLDGAGNVDFQAFPYHCADPSPQTYFTLLVPLSALNECNVAAVWALVVAGDQYPDGSWDLQEVGWGAPKPINPDVPNPSVDYVFEFCPQLCPFQLCAPWCGSVNTCPDVDCGVSVNPPVLTGDTCHTTIIGAPTLPNGQRLDCVRLDVTVTGDGPFTYLWSTGSTASWITVCPTTTTRYWVDVTNAGGTTRLWYTVNVVNAACVAGRSGTHKVLVCHYPPGNPNNPQQICIDWNGVPAHVAAYRTPDMNPRLGHDSGCKIGPCAADPCPNN